MVQDTLLKAPTSNRTLFSPTQETHSYLCSSTFSFPPQTPKLRPIFSGLVLKDRIILESISSHVTMAIHTPKLRPIFSGLLLKDRIQLDNKISLVHVTMAIHHNQDYYTDIQDGLMSPIYFSNCQYTLLE